MPQQTKVTALVEQSRMIPMVDHIVVALLARVAYAMALTGFADVAIENHFSVDRHGDPIAHGRGFPPRSSHRAAGISLAWRQLHRKPNHAAGSF